MNWKPETLEDLLVLVVGVLGIVFLIVGAFGNPLLLVAGLVLLGLFLMRENLSHFSLGRGRVSMRSRAPAARRRSGSTRARGSSKRR